MDDDGYADPINIIKRVANNNRILDFRKVRIDQVATKIYFLKKLVTRVSLLTTFV